MKRFSADFFCPDGVLERGGARSGGRVAKATGPESVRVPVVGRSRATGSPLRIFESSGTVVAAGSPGAAVGFGTFGKVTLWQTAPSSLLSWAAARWGNPKRPRPDVHGVRTLLSRIRQRLREHG